MATGNAFEIFRVDAIDAGALLHQIAGPGAGVRIALLIGEAGGATHSGGRRRAAFPRAGRVDARLPSLQKNVRTFRPSCLVSQTTLALENSSAAGSPCNLAGGATAPADETKENTANSPAATKAARLPHARLVHAGISVPPHLKPGGKSAATSISGGRVCPSHRRLVVTLSIKTCASGTRDYFKTATDILLPALANQARPIALDVVDHLDFAPAQL
jgi:hypothetical protein